MRIRYFTTIAAGLMMLTTGCGDKSSDGSTDTNPSVSNTDVSLDGLPPTTADAHNHPSEGPHHGTIVELGSDEFHAEVVHDDQSVSVYILDSGAKNVVPIATPDLLINLLHDGIPKQFKLTANPDTGDPEGKASRFTLVDAELVDHLDDDAAAPRLSLTIDGTPYRGEIHHDHDHHHGHDH